MAVPKKRTGKSAQAKRRANWKASLTTITKCSNCNADIPSHTVCPECGSYKGKIVSIKNSGNAVQADVKEAKPKKAAKPAKAEDDTKEEVKSSEVVEDTTAGE